MLQYAAKQRADEGIQRCWVGRAARIRHEPYIKIL